MEAILFSTPRVPASHLSDAPTCAFAVFVFIPGMPVQKLLCGVGSSLNSEDTARLLDALKNAPRSLSFTFFVIK